MIEVELKAHVHNMSQVRANVAAFAEYVRDFDKFDSYWHGPDWRFARGTKGFRVRKDNDAVIVTYKTKRNESGIEINKETEFTVSDMEAFLSFITRIGCEPFYQKRKTGSAFTCDGYLIELVTVQGLGDFIEIEKLIEEEDPDTISVVLGTLKTILSRAGVDARDIEARSYSELILQKEQKI